MGFGVWGLGFGVRGLGFGVWGLGCRVWDSGFRVWGLGFWFLNSGLPGRGPSFAPAIFVKKQSSISFILII